MSKAEEAALKAYPKETRDITGFIVDIGHPQYMRDLYIEGYHQAEKDIGDPISWIKEIRGNEKMSRAEEEALKAYPPISMEANYDRIGKRQAFEFGYFKAEKDLALTVEDIKLIDKLLNKCVDFSNPYEEVLKRFSENKRV